MPELIGTALVTAVAGAEVASTVIVGSVTVGQVVGQVVVTAALAGASYALDGRQGGSSAPQKSVLRQGAPYRHFVFGEFMVAGYWALYEAKAGYFQGCLIDCEGPIEGVQSYWSGAELMKINPANNQVQSGHLTVIGLFKSFTGSPDQTRTGSIITDFPTNWNTTDHRLRGIACTEVKIFRPDDASVIAQLPGGVPQDLRRLIRGSLVDDPRGGVGPLWSNNPAAILWWYLQHPDGARIPAEWLDRESFAHVADLCDETVAKFGGYEKRYTANGTASFGEEPREIVKRLLATFDGEAYLTGDGTVALRTGEWEEPLVTLTEEDIIELEFETGSSHGDGFEKVTYRWTAPEAGYVMSSGPAIELEERRSPLVAPLTRALDFEMVTSGSQGWRLAERFARRSWANSHVTGRFKPKALLCLDQAVVRITDTLFGIDAVYKIHKYEEDWRTNEVRMQLSEVTEAMFVESVPPEIPIERQVYDSNVYISATVGAVPVPSWTSPATTLQLTARQQAVTGGHILIIEAATPSDPDYTFEAEYRAAGDTTWLPALSGGGRSPWQAVTGLITLGTTYEVRGRYVTPEGFVSYVFSGGDAQRWPTHVSLPTDASEAAPGPPTGRTDSPDTPDPGNTTVSWTQPTSAGFQYTEVRSGGAFDTWETATVIARVLGSGTKSVVVANISIIWLRSFTSAGAGSTIA